MKNGAHPGLLWLQIDPDSAFKRSSKRDRRNHDDHYAQEMNVATIKELLTGMQNPEITENFLVLSGKHVFNTQKNAVFRYLVEKRLVNLDTTAPQLSKPGLVNIVPNPAAGRVDLSRRNINIQ